MPSRPREFHPEPLTDPDLNLSIHPARVTARRLPPSAEPSSSSRYSPVGPSSTAMTRPLRSTSITLASSLERNGDALVICHRFIRCGSAKPVSNYYEAVRPSPAHRYFQPRGWSRLCFFPWHRRPGSPVPYKSQIELRAAYMPDAAWAVSVHFLSFFWKMGQLSVLASFNRISTLLQRCACARLSQSCLSKSCFDFSATFTTIAFDNSGLRWLEIST